jgi:myo-inositol-1(or 4)-monophosphatase
MTQALQERWQLAQSLAKEAGQVLMSFFRKRELKVEKKGELDLVTQADRASEDLIVAAIRQHFPHDRILAEEGGAREGQTEGFRWIIDPLDGTTNFVHGVPHFSVAIAIAQGETILAGIVLDPAKNECFSALRGQGAICNGRAMRVRQETNLNHVLSASGFPYDRRALLDDLLVNVRTALAHFQGFRRFGVASLDLAYVADGRFDLFWEIHLKPWDLAAGCLLVTEAGGEVRGLDGGVFSLDQGHVLATHPVLMPNALDLLGRPS